MPSNSNYYCAECRVVNKPCPHPQKNAGPKWEAPKKNNDAAWKRIAAGDIWWNDKLPAKKALRLKPHPLSADGRQYIRNR